MPQKRRAILNTSLAAIAVVGLAGCAEDMTGDLQTKVSQLESQVSEKDTALKAAQDMLARRPGTASQPIAVASGGPDLPPNAKAGECYARVFTPPTYKSITETLLVQQEAERIEVIPAVYKPADKRVLFKSASQRFEVIPAKYGWVEEQVMVKPEGEQLITEPPIYEAVSERILVKPAYTTWKKGRGPIQKINEATGEIMCLVDIPAEYRTVSKQVLKRPAQTRSVKIPAVYETVKKRVVVEPAKTRVVEIPAEYRMLRINELIEGAKQKRIMIPARHRTVTKSEKTSDGNIAWRPILCETNTTKGVVQRLQTALKSNGFDPGRVDGVIGSDTMRAVTAYQKSKKQASGQLTIETLKSLDVSL